MNRSVYIASTDANSGKSLVSLGILQMVMRQTPNVGVFRPIINDYPEGKQDNHIATMISHFNLNIKYEESFAYTRSQVVDLKNNGKIDEVLDFIIQKYKALEDKYDFILIEGTPMNVNSAFDINLNVLIAKSLNIPVVLVIKDTYKTIEELEQRVSLEVNSFVENDTKVIATIVNKSKKDKQTLVSYLEAKLSKEILFGIIPREIELSYPTLKEVAEAVHAHILYGEDNLNKPVKKFVIGAMQLPNFLNYVEDDSLIIIPGDRSDLLVGSLLANLSINYPKISGVLLTVGVVPHKNIIRLINDSQLMVPILAVKDGTFETANIISGIKSKIYPQSTSKIKTGIDIFEQNVDVPALEQKISSFKVEGITPRMFQYNMVKSAKNAQKHIVLPEGSDERVLKAASMLAEDGVVNLTVLGNPEEISQNVQKLGLYWDEERIQLVDPIKSPKFNEYAQTLCELRKSKGMELPQAQDLMMDATYYGTMMVYKGDADGMVSGAQNTTAHTIRPALQFVKTKPGIKTVSSVFFMLLDDRVLVYGDCAIVPNPTAEQLAEIAITSAETAKAFGIEPKVAMLSYSSGNSGSGQDVDKVRAATLLVKELRPDILVEGPIQYDAAVDPSVGKNKMPGSLVAGQANVLIFPDLNTGNNTYKAVQRETDGLAIGPVLQGLNKPINDLSRGAKIEDIYNTVVITSIQSI